MKKIISVALLSILSLAVIATGADVFYVQSEKAKVMAGPSFKSEVLGVVTKGHKFVSVGREGSWVKVMFEGKEGYVSSLIVAEHPPIERQSLIDKGQEIQEGARRRASTFVSAAAARGLTAEDRRRLSSEEKANYYALEQIESLTVSDDEVMRFIGEEGR